MLTDKFVFKSIACKIERDTSRSDLISAKELKRSIQFFRFNEREYQAIIRILIEEGYIERVDKQNFKRKKSLISQTAI